MEERMNKETLLNLLETLGVDPKEFTILSSSALTLRGIMPNAGDLDIAVTDKGFEQLKEKYDLKLKPNGFFIVSDRIECVKDPMEGRRELVHGYYLQDIHNYYEYLLQSERQKDKDRIPLVEQYIKENY